MKQTQPWQSIKCAIVTVIQHTNTTMATGVIPPAQTGHTSLIQMFIASIVPIFAKLVPDRQGTVFHAMIDTITITHA